MELQKIPSIKKQQENRPTTKLLLFCNLKKIAPTENQIKLNFRLLVFELFPSVLCAILY